MCDECPGRASEQVRRHGEFGVPATEHMVRHACLRVSEGGPRNVVGAKVAIYLASDFEELWPEVGPRVGSLVRWCAFTTAPAIPGAGWGNEGRK